MKRISFKILVLLGIIALGSCKKDSPEADPQTSITTTISGLKVHFENTSTNASSYHWEFGDGSVSDSMSPTHTYSHSGTFTYKITAYSPNKTKHTFTTAMVTTGKMDSSETDPQTSITTSINGLKIHFENTSTNASSYHWEFGDGSVSDSMSPTHTYSHSGSFTYKVTAYSPYKTKNKITTAVVTTGKMEKLIKLETSLGECIIWLYDLTPKHKKNFIKLAESGFYNDLLFHRVIKNFMNQGGDPNTKSGDPSTWGTGGPGYTIDAEIDSSKLKHEFGAVAAARLGGPSNPQKASSGSQFYIVNSSGGAHFLDGDYTVFGMVIKGLDVVSTIGNSSTDRNDRPVNKISMKASTFEISREDIKTVYGFDIK